MAYSAEEIELMFGRLISGIREGRSVRSILRDEGMPSRDTLDKWLESDSIKVDQYARALEDRAELKFESIEADYMEEPQRDPESGRIDSAWVALQRLKIDAKKWELAKMMPKKYGDKQEIDHKNNGESFIPIINIHAPKQSDNG